MAYRHAYMFVKDPLTPHFHIVKLGFTWVLTCTTIYVFCKNKKIITFFLLKIIIFTALKNGSLLHMCVIVMSRFLIVFRYFEGPTPVLVTANKDLLAEVFVKKFKKFHARKVFATK